MNKEQKNKLSELLEAVQKTTDKDLSVEAYNIGLWDGFGNATYLKGKHYIDYYRKFECYSQTLGMVCDDTVGLLVGLINHCLDENDYNAFFEELNSLSFDGDPSEELFKAFGDEYPPYFDWDFINTDSYELSDEFEGHSMDDDIPEDILDEDGNIDSNKLEDNGWEFQDFYSSDGCEYESCDMEINSVTINVDDKSFTFEKDK